GERAVEGGRVGEDDEQAGWSVLTERGGGQGGGRVPGAVDGAGVAAAQGGDQFGKTLRSLEQAGQVLQAVEGRRRCGRGRCPSHFIPDEQGFPGSGGAAQSAPPL